MHVTTTVVVVGGDFGFPEGFSFSLPLSKPIHTYIKLSAWYMYFFLFQNNPLFLSRYSITFTFFQV